MTYNEQEIEKVFEKYNHVDKFNQFSQEEIQQQKLLIKKYKDVVETLKTNLRREYKIDFQRKQLEKQSSDNLQTLKTNLQEKYQTDFQRKKEQLEKQSSENFQCKKSKLIRQKKKNLQTTITELENNYKEKLEKEIKNLETASQENLEKEIKKLETASQKKLEKEIKNLETASQENLKKEIKNLETASQENLIISITNLKGKKEEYGKKLEILNNEINYIYKKVLEDQENHWKINSESKISKSTIKQFINLQEEKLKNKSIEKNERNLINLYITIGNNDIEILDLLCLISELEKINITNSKMQELGTILTSNQKKNWWSRCIDLINKSIFRPTTNLFVNVKQKINEKNKKDLEDEIKKLKLEIQGIEREKLTSFWNGFWLIMSCGCYNNHNKKEQQIEKRKQKIKDKKQEIEEILKNKYYDDTSEASISTDDNNQMQEQVKQSNQLGNDNFSKSKPSTSLAQL